MKNLIILVVAMFLFITCEKTENEEIKQYPYIEILGPSDGSIFYKKDGILFSDTYYEIDYISLRVSIKDCDGWIIKVVFTVDNIDTNETIYKTEIKKNYEDFYSRLYPLQIELGEYIFEVMAMDNDNLVSYKKSKFSVLEY